MPGDLDHLLAVARGERAPDLVVEGARVFSAFTREWLDADVGVANGRIAGFAPAAGGRRVDGRGHHLVPGFIDAHVHVESSKLSVEEFSRLLLARGTTTVVADPHEFANVLGAPGIEWFLDACAQVPLDVFVMVPSCVPASPLESARGPLGPDDMRELLAKPGVIGIAEMMNFPAVIAGDEGELAQARARAGRQRRRPRARRARRAARRLPRGRASAPTTRRRRGRRRSSAGAAAPGC